MKPGTRAPDIAWKDNWEASKQRFVNWWRHEGMLIGMYGDLNTGHCVHEAVAKPMRPSSLRECYCNAEYRAAENHYRLSSCVFPLDILGILARLLDISVLFHCNGDRLLKRQHARFGTANRR